MSDPTLIQCEKELIKVKGALKHPEAVRRGLLHLVRFLEFLEQNHVRAEPFVLRLEADLPALKDARLLIGTDPEMLWDLYKKITLIGNDSPQLLQSNRFIEFQTQIRQHLIMLLAFVGELQGVISVIRNRFDMPLISDRKDHSLTVAFMDRRELLTKVLDDPGINEELKKQITLILNFWKERTETRRPTIYIPVQEEGDYGLLRRISLDVIERHDLPYDTIRTDVALIGADSSKYELSEIPVTVARNQIRKITPTQREVYFKGLLHFELGHILHDGRSVHVAMALLILSGILKSQNHQDIYYPRNGVSFTGELDENGALISVDPESIRAKVHAAFFSWIDMLAVPTSQIDEFIKVRDELSHKYPNRKLDIHPVHHFEDVIYDRRLTQYRYISKVNKVVRYAWKNKLGAIGVTTIVLLLSIVGRLIYGPLDKNPMYFEVERETVILYNKYNQETLRIPWDEHAAKIYLDYRERHVNHYNPIGLFDLTGDGNLDLIFGRQPSGEVNWGSGYITAINGITGKVIWEYQINITLDFPNKPESGKNWMLQHVLFDEIDGKPKLIFNLSDRMYFPSIIVTADPLTGKMDSNYYVHIGSVEDLVLVDTNHDNKNDLVISGSANYANASFMAILDTKNLNGHGPSNDEYQINGYDRGSELHYLIYPRTIIGRSIVVNHNRPSIHRVSIIPSYNELYFDIMDSYVGEIRIGNYNNLPGLNFFIYTDYQLNVKRISTSDAYDAAASRLLMDGILTQRPDAAYFDGYVNNEIRYYEDGNWVRLSERRINRVAADDSSPTDHSQSVSPAQL